MIENEIVKIANKVFGNKIVLALLVLTPLVLSRFDYSLLQVVVLTFGGFLIIVALYMFYTNNKKTKLWIKTVGKVIDIKWHDEIIYSGHTVKFGQELIIYKTETSKEYTVLNDVSNAKPQKKGHKIKVFYNPNNEKEILVYDFFNMYAKFFFLIVFGVIMIYYAPIN